MTDHYATLGVDRSASKEDIKKAYKKLAMEHHPDHGGDPDKFKNINEAHSTLSNDQKRKEYDDPNPFERIFGGMGFGGGMRSRPKKPDLNAPRNGQFIGVEAELPFKVFIFGGTHKITISFHEGCDTCGGKGFQNGEECSVCHGDGFVQNVQHRPGFTSSSMAPCPHCRGLGLSGTDKCEDCNGSGNKFVRDKEFEFEVPPGAGPGTKHIISGVGRTGLNGGRTGDVGILITSITRPDLDKLSSEQLEQLKSLVEVLDNVD